MDFLNVTEDTTVEQEVDSVGGFKVYDSALIQFGIRAAYFDTFKKSGGNNLTILLETPNGDKYTHVEYLANKEGDNTYLDKKTKEKKLLPGFSKMTSLAKLLSDGKTLKEQLIEDRKHAIRNPETKKDENVDRKTLIDWKGKVVWVGMLKIEQNKQVLSGDKYVDTAETRFVNEIDKFFDSEKRTWLEVEEGKEATFFTDWVKANEGKTRNKVKAVANGAVAGAPIGQAAGAAPIKFDE